VGEYLFLAALCVKQGIAQDRPVTPSPIVIDGRGEPYDEPVALFADGAVTAIQAGMAPAIFEALATIAGGEDVGQVRDE
jgi:hypothetical protein